jgi:hypothetical protein
LTLISHWRERWIQNKSGVTVIVGVNEAENQSILKKTAIRIASVMSDYFNLKHANTEIVSSVNPGRMQT